MVRQFMNVPARKFHKFFHVIAPCICDREELDTKYNISLITDGDDPFISRVTATCLTCGDSKSFQISRSILLDSVVFETTK